MFTNNTFLLISVRFSGRVRLSSISGALAPLSQSVNSPVVPLGREPSTFDLGPSTFDLINLSTNKLKENHENQS